MTQSQRRHYQNECFAIAKDIVNDWKCVEWETCHAYPAERGRNKQITQQSRTLVRLDFFELLTDARCDECEDHCCTSYRVIKYCRRQMSPSPSRLRCHSIQRLSVVKWILAAAPANTSPSSAHTIAKLDGECTSSSRSCTSIGDIIAVRLRFALV